MSIKRVLVVVVALGAGLGSAMLAVKMLDRGPPPAPAPLVVAPPAPPSPTEDVLVAAKEIGLGTAVGPQHFAWAPWPDASVNDSYVRRSQRPNAIEELTGALARSPFLQGEPIRDGKLVKAGRGFLSVILAPGMRAIAVEVKSAATAGGFILPGDRVDVLLTRAQAAKNNGADPFVTETILTNVRVLAIDQLASEKQGETAMKPAETATLELSPAQAEILAQAQQLGTVSLALRSLADSQPDAEHDDPTERSGTVKMIRFGQTSKISTKR